LSANYTARSAVLRWYALRIGKFWYALSLAARLAASLSLVQVPPFFSDKEKNGGQERIRTSEAQVQQISSALKLP